MISIRQGIREKSDSGENRIISIRGPPGLQGLEGPKRDPSPQGPKVDEGDFGSDGTNDEANDAIINSYLDNVKHIFVFTTLTN